MTKPETDDEFLRIMTTDAQGNRVFRGLNVEESREYKSYLDKMKLQFKDETAFPWASVQEMQQEKQRYLELYEKHERERIQTLGAESELRDRPTIN